MLPKIAITGGVAEGKSQLVAYAQEAGLKVLSADEVARELVEEEAIQEEIASRIQLELPLDLQLLRNQVFRFSEARHTLNEILHPLILERLLSTEASIIEAPLLIETCVHVFFERIWIAVCGPEEQYQRLKKRMGDEQLIREILVTQLPTRVKCVFADRIFDTKRPFEEVRSEFMQALHEEGLVSSD
jgi:dephospho-CoA kinase